MSSRLGSVAGVSSDLAEYLDRAIDFSFAYANLVKRTLDCTYSVGQDTFAEAFLDLQVAWELATRFRQFRGLGCFFPFDFRNEVAKARQTYSGGSFDPNAELPFQFLRDYFSPFESAFGFIETLSSQLWQVNCYDSWDIEQLDPKPTFKAAHVVGRLSALIRVSDVDEIVRELKKEVVAVSKLRSESKSWNFSVEGDSGIVAESEILENGKRSFDEEKILLAIAFIRACSPSKVIQIAKHIDVDDRTCYSNYMPELKRRGVKKTDGKYTT